MKALKYAKRIIGLLLFSACFTACVKDTNLDPPPPADASFKEDFDTLLSAYNRGWRFVNRSNPIGPSQWQEGSGEFAAYTSKSTNQGYAYTDYESTGGDTGTISNWLVSPALSIKNGDTLIFYTRSLLFRVGNDYTDYTNRLQVRTNNDEDIIAGYGIDPGDFNSLQLDINEEYHQFIQSEFDAGVPNSLLAYPHEWTKFEVIFSGIDKPANRRFAFRYLLEGGGAQGKGSGVGIDHIIFSSKK
jgi:hypothetical protein